MGLAYNHTGPLAEYKPGVSMISKYTFADNKKINFHGEGYVAEYISLITEDDVRKVLEENGFFQRNNITDQDKSKISKQILDDIQALKFKHPKIGTTVDAGEALLLVEGNPLAIELTSTIVSTIVGSMSARGTLASKIVSAGRDIDLSALSNPDDPKSFIYSDEEIIQAIRFMKANAKPSDFNDLAGLATRLFAKTDEEIRSILQGEGKKAFLKEISPLFKRKSLFSHFGFRRGESGDGTALSEVAATQGGFDSAARTDSNRPHRFAGKLNKPITGTMAHFFVLKYTAAYKQALVDGKGKEFRQALGIPEEQYLAIMKRNSEATKPEDKVNIYDYICFCAYIRAMQDIEEDQRKGVPQDKWFPNRRIILLIDTTNTLSGMRAAMEAAITTNRNLDGVRLDTTPLKYIKDAKKLYEQRIFENPSDAQYLKNTAFFSTDDVNETTAAQITKEAVVNGINTAFGVGSRVENAKAATLERTDNVSTEEAASYTHLTQTFSLAELSARVPDSPAFEPIIHPNPFEDAGLATDLYTQNLLAAGYYIDKRLQEQGLGASEEIRTVTRVTASSMFRVTKDSDNFLLICGVGMILRTLNNFKFDKAFVDNLKNNTGLSLSDKQYELLYKIADHNQKGLDIKITPLADGTIARPGTPLINIEGNPDHVLLVESFITSTVGSMSSVATTALKISNSVSDMDYSLLTLLDPTQKAKIRQLYGLKVDANIPEELNNKANIKAKFVYCGLDNQRSLTPLTSYAAIMGGFSGTSMSSDTMPVFVPGVHYQVYLGLPQAKKSQIVKVCFDFDDKHPTESIEKFLKFLASDTNPNLVVQLRGNLSVENIQSINIMAQNMVISSECTEQMLKGLSRLSNIEYWVRKPLCDAENKKGFVYKPVGVTLCRKDGKDPVFQYVTKAAGADGAPNEKTSIPGLEQRTLILREQGKPVAQMIIDLKILRDNGVNVQSPQAILTYMLDQQNKKQCPKIYYESGDKLSLADFTLKSNLTAEFLLQEATRINGNLKTPQIPDVQTELTEGPKRAQENYEQGMHTVPVLIEPRLYGKLTEILSSQEDPAEKEYTEHLAMPGRATGQPKPRV